MGMSDLSIKQFKPWHRGRPVFILIFVILAVALGSLWPRIFYKIESGHAGVLYRMFGGTVTQAVRTEGLQVIFPWNHLEIYDVRLQQVEHSFPAISSDGFEIKAALSIRFRLKIESLGLLHQKIGPDYLQKIILPDVQSLVRTTLKRYTPEEIFATKRSLIQEAFQNALGNLGENYVQVDDLSIKSITLSPGVQSAIEAKLIGQLGNRSPLSKNAHPNPPAGTQAASEAPRPKSNPSLPVEDLDFESFTLSPPDFAEWAPLVNSKTAPTPIPTPTPPPQTTAPERGR